MSVRPALAPRPGYERLRAYSPGVDTTCAIDLSDNTNLWGTSPAAERALREFSSARVTRYPSRYGDALKAAIASRLGVPAEMIVTGPGSDGVLDPAIRAFGMPGDTMALSEPTFVMAAPFGVMNGLSPVQVPLLQDYDVDADALLSAEARITYLCSPNNPTGRSIALETIRRVVDGAAGLVIVDEAYAEFAASDALQLVRESDRVLVTRTFSKAYGLAGLRVGYGIAAPEVIAAIEKARGPYAVGAPGEAAAVAALHEGQDWMMERVIEARAARSRLQDALGSLGLEPVPSDANFVFVPVCDAAAIARALAERGISVRAFTGLRAVSPALAASGGNALRITVAPPDMLDSAVAALADILREREAA